MNLRDLDRIKALLREDARLDFPKTQPLLGLDRILKFLHSTDPPNGRSKGEFSSALAGLAEPGETLEETVVREVREETGIEVQDIRYFGRQPWPFPDSLMITFETSRSCSHGRRFTGPKADASR